MIQNILILSGALLCLLTPLRAQIVKTDQQVFASVGDAAVSGSVQLSWTIGESVVATETGGGVTVQQGFQQGVDDAPFSWPVNLEEMQMNLPVVVYPNPVKSHLWVEVGAANELTVEVYDVTGKKILSTTEYLSDGQRLELSTINWVKGTYYLGVTSATVPGQMVFTLIKQ